MTKVSVVIPAYNAAASLETAVHSVLAQTCTDLEVIVVDDGSRDDTYATALRLADQDDRVAVLRNDRNLGVSATRNRAVQAADGDWIALLDADDAWLPERLERLLAVSDDADVVCDDFLIVTRVTAGSPHPRYSFFAWLNIRLHKPWRLDLANFVRYDLGLLKPLISKSFLRRHGIHYDVGLRVAEDYYLYVQLLAAGARWLQVPEAYYLYARQPGSLSRGDDVARQHVRGTAALLSDSTVAADPRVRAALRRHNRNVRAALMRSEIAQLLRTRRFVKVGNLLLGQPYSILLILDWTARNLGRRVARRWRNPQNAVPARIFSQ